MNTRVRIDIESARDIPVPANLSDYVDILGIELAVNFFLHFGGAQMYIPANPKGRSEMEAFVGTTSACALGKRLGGIQSIPLAKRWSARVMHARDISTAETARRLRVTESTVRAYIR